MDFEIIIPGTNRCWSSDVFGELTSDDWTDARNKIFNGLDFRGCRIVNVDFSWADLSFCDFRGVIFEYVIFRHSNLSNANLTAAQFFQAIFFETNISDSILFGNVFGNSTLSRLKLSTCKEFQGSSRLGANSIDLISIRDTRKAERKNLLNLDVPELAIDYIDSIMTKEVIRMHSCFISYSDKDKAFAEKLFERLQGNNVKCWYAPEHLKIGDQIRSSIDGAIDVHDKLLLVLSRSSMSSQWVEQEVESALSKERATKKTVLFPISIDTAFKGTEIKGWPALLKNTRNIGDFQKWRKGDDEFESCLSRLLRDLKHEN